MNMIARRMTSQVDRRDIGLCIQSSHRRSR
jgi:hypothetical protein